MGNAKRGHLWLQISKLESSTFPRDSQLGKDQQALFHNKQERISMLVTGAFLNPFGIEKAGLNEKSGSSSLSVGQGVYSKYLHHCPAVSISNGWREVKL